MSFAPPARPAEVFAEALSVAASAPTAGELVARFVATRETVAHNHAQLSEIVNGVVNDMIGVAAARPDFDIEEFAAVLLKQELGFEDDRLRVLRDIDKLLKAVGRTRGDLLRPLNDGRRDFIAANDAMRRIYHDARWRVLEWEAANRPATIDKTKIQGEAGDLDDYLANSR